MSHKGLSQVEIDRGLARIFEALFADEIEAAIKGSQEPKEQKNNNGVQNGAIKS